MDDTGENERRRGEVLELLRMRPHDHIGWVYSGTDQFVELATRFLRDGATLGERLVLVARDPRPSSLEALEALVDPGTLQISSVCDVYGPSGLVDAARQRATFEEVLADALNDGFTGIRVAADNSPLVRDPERLAAWIEWEIVADHFMSAHPVTGLCAFDRLEVDVDKLRHLATLHPLFSASEPIPQYRMFVDGEEALCIEGQVDSFAVRQLLLALNVLPSKTKVSVDMKAASFTSQSAFGALLDLCTHGTPVTVSGPPSRLEPLRRVLVEPPDSLSLVEA